MESTKEKLALTPSLMAGRHLYDSVMQDPISVAIKDEILKVYGTARSIQKLDF